MPEPRGEGPNDEGHDTGSGVPADRGSLDVPEWVSEMRRLYVEPKTRARMREEGVIAPQKRQRGLAGVRSRRAAAAPVEASVPVAPPLPVGSAAQPEPSEHTELGVVTVDERTDVSVPLPTDAREPATLERRGTAPLDPGERPPPVHLPAPPDALEEDSGPAASAAGAESAPAPPSGREHVSAWLTSYLSATGHGDDSEGAPAEAAATHDDETFEADAEEPPLGSSEHQEVPARSLAELAGLVEPEEGWPQPFGRVAPLQVDAEAHDPLPVRADTVPALTVSWRETEVFDVSVPGADADHEAILVEPPSQVVAQSRVRRRPLDLGSGADADGDTADQGTAGQGKAEQPSPVAVVEEPSPQTRASSRAAGSRSGKRRRVLLVVLSVVVLAVVAMYLLLAGPGGVATAG